MTSPCFCHVYAHVLAEVWVCGTSPMKLFVHEPPPPPADVPFSTFVSQAQDRPYLLEKVTKRRGGGVWAGPTTISTGAKRDGPQFLKAEGGRSGSAPTKSRQLSLIRRVMTDTLLTELVAQVTCCPGNNGDWASVTQH